MIHRRFTILIAAVLLVVSSYRGGGRIGNYQNIVLESAISEEVEESRGSVRDSMVEFTVKSEPSTGKCFGDLRHWRAALTEEAPGAVQQEHLFQPTLIESYTARQVKGTVQFNRKGDFLDIALVGGTVYRFIEGKVLELIELEGESERQLIREFSYPENSKRMRKVSFNLSSEAPALKLFIDGVEIGRKIFRDSSKNHFEIRGVVLGPSSPEIIEFTVDGIRRGHSYTVECSTDKDAV